MKVIKKYKLLEYSSKRVNNNIVSEIEEGKVEGPYYSEESPNTLFDSEEDAITEAYKRSKYGTYIIVPHITFDIW